PFIFDEPAGEFFSGVNFISKFIQLLSWNKHPCLDFHKGSSDKDKFACYINVQLFKFVDVIQKILGYLCYRYVIYVKFVALNEKEQEVKRPYKVVSCNGVCLHHSGSTLLLFFFKCLMGSIFPLACSIYLPPFLNK